MLAIGLVCHNMTHIYVVVSFAKLIEGESKPLGLFNRCATWFAFMVTDMAPDILSTNGMR